MMKSKKARYESSSDDSDESGASVESISSSDSDSYESSTLGKSNKKKRKRVNSSESDSDSDEVQKRSKKRKHKKKKKKHSKKKHRAQSGEESATGEDVSTASDDEITSKKKRKHKHKHKYKKNRSSSLSEREFSEKHEHDERRLQSVVKERHASSEEGSRHSRTYYQKEYHRSASVEYVDRREREVERFYRGSSKDRAHAPYTERSDNRYDNRVPARYVHQVPPEKYARDHDYRQEYNGANEEYRARQQREYNEYRIMKYESRGQMDNVMHRRPKDDASGFYHQGQPERRDVLRYNQQDDRSDNRRRQHEVPREYRERRNQTENNPYRERERNYPERKERYHEESYSTDRRGDGRRERPVNKDVGSYPERFREQDVMRSPENSRVQKRPEGRQEIREYESDNRYRGKKDDDKLKERYQERVSIKEERKEDYRRKDERSDNKSSEHRGRSYDRRSDRERVNEKSESYKSRERKSRFSEAESKNYSWGKSEDFKPDGKDKGEKEKPNFGLSGKLTQDTNMVNGVVIKYSEPEDAKQPKRRWRFYPFKGDKALPILYIHRQSSFLLGRDKKVVDIPLEHPSVSKQHGALQYRATPFTRADGSQGRRVRPYIIDLDSANGTFVNNKKIDPRRYVELFERDVVKFGFSQREYVLLHENSKDDNQDDDNDPLPTTTDQIKREKQANQEVIDDGD